MTRRVSAMIVASAALATFVLVGCDAMPGRPRQADHPVSPSHVMAFSALYGQNCTGCHGAEGNLGAARPLNDPIYLALVGPDRLTHLGCPVRWFAPSRLFMCPCHGGVYYEDGSQASGPPPRGLYEYDYRIRDGQLWVQGGQIPTLSEPL